MRIYAQHLTGKEHYTWKLETLALSENLNPPLVLFQDNKCETCFFLRRIFLLTSSMEHIPRETANFVAAQNISSILWNPKFHYRLHKSSPPVPILNLTNSAHTTPFYLSNIHLNISSHLRLGLPSGSFSSYRKSNFLASNSNCNVSENFPRWYFKINHDHFLPHIFPFIIVYHPSVQRFAVEPALHNFVNYFL
jgi:hypothetical protein